MSVSRALQCLKRPCSLLPHIYFGQCPANCIPLGSTVLQRSRGAAAGREFRLRIPGLMFDAGDEEMTGEPCLAQL